MTVNTILSSHNIRKTKNRSSILKTFIHRRIALSEIDLEKALISTCDRTTIYRTLKTFLVKGVIHKVIDESSIVKYALCKEYCDEKKHNHEHVHFKCNNCRFTICLDAIPIQSISLPSGYTKEEANFLIVGTCKECNMN